MTGAVLVAASHGTSDPAGQRAVAALVSTVAERVTDFRVREAFVDVQTPDVSAVLDSISATPVVVVPLLLSSGYHVRVDLARVASAAANPTVVVTDALGPDPRLVSILERRLADIALADDDVLVLAAAGSSDGRAVDDCRLVAAALGERLGRAVQAAFISAAQPELKSAISQARADGAPRVVVVSYLLAPGYFADLAAAAGGDVTTPPLLIDGDPAPAELVDIVIERYQAAHVSGVLPTPLDRAPTV
ncbi:CbiX/SirB N-terminal domain-containing protein [Pseudolysinimonas sp.]|uniref:sirohydrochlorin chelatase n=1 Tax=Pseudolysinimonas sp. TaxID=2680009 RepID=UPI00286C1214|nr:CbiX/SirB N-terminal domain-containing protein [Pseudolysinimonas sp.]